MVVDISFVATTFVRGASDAQAAMALLSKAFRNQILTTYAAALKAGKSMVWATGMLGEIVRVFSSSLSVLNGGCDRVASRSSYSS